MNDYSNKMYLFVIILILQSEKSGLSQQNQLVVHLLEFSSFW